ncbi:hypothetical protein QWA68_014849 [Fusarium oxysporum]|nr:hypothetical protein QWA68_014849 [Fusarium oxysporum]
MGSTVLPVDQLRASLTASEIIVPGDNGYKDSLHRWSEAAEKPAAYVVQVTSAQDISKALLLAQEHQLDVAVVGGGHSTSGSSSTNGGLVVDLTKMRNVTVEYANKTIKAEAGCIWEDVDYAAAKYGLATVSGTVNNTRYGLTINNLLGAEVILADGRVALRGAGQSFGVATSFTFCGYKQANSVYGGLLVFKPEALDKSGMVVGFSAPAPASKVSVLTIIFYNGDQAKAKEYFAPLFALGPLADLTREMPYGDVNAMLNTVSTQGDQKTQKGSAFSAPLSISLAKTLLEDYSKFIIEVPDAVKSIILMDFFSQREVNKVSQTAMSFANRGEHYNILFGTRWEKTGDGVREYGNYEGVATSLAQDIFGVNYEKVLALKKQYDPKNVFNKGAGKFLL